MGGAVQRLCSLWLLGCGQRGEILHQPPTCLQNKVLCTAPSLLDSFRHPLLAGDKTSPRSRPRPRKCLAPCSGYGMSGTTRVSFGKYLLPPPLPSRASKIHRCVRQTEASFHVRPAIRARASRSNGFHKTGARMALFTGYRSQAPALPTERRGGSVGRRYLDTGSPLLFYHMTIWSTGNASVKVTQCLGSHPARCAVCKYGRVGLFGLAL